MLDYKKLIRDDKFLEPTHACYICGASSEDAFLFIIQFNRTKLFICDGHCSEDITALEKAARDVRILSQVAIDITRTTY